MTRYIAQIRSMDGQTYNAKDLEAIKEVSYENNVLTFTKQNGTTTQIEIRSASEDIAFLDDKAFIAALVD